MDAGKKTGEWAKGSNPSRSSRIVHRDLANGSNDMIDFFIGHTRKNRKRQVTPVLSFGVWKLAGAIAVLGLVVRV